MIASEAAPVPGSPSLPSGAGSPRFSICGPTQTLCQAGEATARAPVSKASPALDTRGLDSQANPCRISTFIHSFTQPSTHLSIHSPSHPPIYPFIHLLNSHSFSAYYAHKALSSAQSPCPHQGHPHRVWGTFCSSSSSSTSEHHGEDLEDQAPGAREPAVWVTAENLRRLEQCLAHSRAQ